MDKGKDKSGPISDTERFDPSQYRLTAVVMARHAAAMVEDPMVRGMYSKWEVSLGKMVRVTRIAKEYA